MGRLELAGINPWRTPPTRFWRALWALFVEYKTSFSDEVHGHVVGMWTSLGGHDPAAAAVAAPAPLVGVAAPRRSTAPPTRPGERREGRPTRADMEAWAIASAQAGTNFIGDKPPGQAGTSGSAQRVGG